MSGHLALADLIDLRGRSAVVTGAAMGIGRGIAERLAEAGAQVLIADVDLEAAETAAKELAELGYAVTACRTDVASTADVEAMIATAVRRHGRLDILVNNAGIFPFQPVLTMEPEQFDRVIAVNLRGTYLCSRAAAERMVAAGTGGRIVNVTSIDALHPSAVGLAHYDASKHGIHGFTKNLALELAPYGITVNAVAPGATMTPGATGVGPAADAAVEAIRSRIPLRRMGEADDIARAALFLVTDLAAYVTGAQLVVDGGLLLT